MSKLAFQQKGSGLFSIFFQVSSFQVSTTAMTEPHHCRARFQLQKSNLLIFFANQNRDVLAYRWIGGGIHDNEHMLSAHKKTSHRGDLLFNSFHFFNRSNVCFLEKLLFDIRSRKSETSSSMRLLLALAIDTLVEVERSGRTIVIMRS